MSRRQTVLRNKRLLTSVRRAVLVLLLPVAAAGLHAQPDTAGHTGRYWGISAGLGATLVRAPDVVNYINQYFQPPEKVADFGTAVEFFGSAEFQVAASWMIKGEYSYLLKSYNVDVDQSPEITYTIQMPTILAEYFVEGRGYLFQFGAGAGYRRAKLNLRYIGEQNYRADGVGIKLEAVGNTAFDEHLFGYIGGDARVEFIGTFTDAAGTKVSMRAFGVGLKFGLTYYF